MILHKEKFYFMNTRRLITIRIIDEFSLKDCAEGYIDIKGQTHKGIEILENFGSGFCLKIKIKQHPLFQNDIYVLCMEDEDLRNLWVSSFSMQLDLSLESGYNDVPDAASSAVIKSPFVDNADAFNMYSSRKAKPAK